MDLGQRRSHLADVARPAQAGREDFDEVCARRPRGDDFGRGQRTGDDRHVVSVAMAQANDGGIKIRRDDELRPGLDGLLRQPGVQDRTRAENHRAAEMLSRNPQLL